ncbi:uncharacterized protein DS421_8g243320 [Arachis hypogaea]|nr:uncharacterized protein LOC112707322 [Arachis hypogaea]QHO31642.1 uncharacterized protein DS421_8g243320 [Arachis hypogaea]
MVTHEPRVQARVEGGTVVAAVSPNGAAITAVNRDPEREEMRAMAGGEKTLYLEAAVVLSAPPSSLPQGQPLSCMAELERESSGAEQERERDLKLGWESNHRVQPLFVSPAPPLPELPPSKRGFDRCRCRCRKRELCLCDSDRREWFCDFREHRRSFWLFFPSSENSIGKGLKLVSFPLSF